MRRLYLVGAIAMLSGVLLWHKLPRTAPTPPGYALPPFHARVASPTPRPADEPTPPVLLSGGFLFFEDFEHGVARWQLDGRARGVGWHLLHAHTCGGAYTMHVGRDDQAPFESFPLVSTLTLAPAIDLTRAVAPFLTYDVKGAASPSTAVVIQPQCRLRGGWRDLGTPARARYAMQSTRFADLRPFVGERLSLRFRATLAPAAAPIVGMYLDNVQVVETGHARR